MAESIEELKAKLAEAQSLLKDQQDIIEAKSKSAETGLPSFKVGKNIVLMRAKSFALTFDHEEGNVKISKGSVVTHQELEKLPKLLEKLLEKKIGIFEIQTETSAKPK